MSNSNPVASTPSAAPSARCVVFTGKASICHSAKSATVSATQCMWWSGQSHFNRPATASKYQPERILPAGQARERAPPARQPLAQRHRRRRFSGRSRGCAALGARQRAEEKADRRTSTARRPPIRSNSPPRSGMFSATAMVMISSRMKRIASVRDRPAHRRHRAGRPGEQHHRSSLTQPWPAASNGDARRRGRGHERGNQARVSCASQSRPAPTPPTSRLPTAMARPSPRSPSRCAEQDRRRHADRPKRESPPNRPALRATR